VEDENAFDQTNEARIELVLNFLSAIKVSRYSIFTYMQTGWCIKSGRYTMVFHKKDPFLFFFHNSLK